MSNSHIQSTFIILIHVLLCYCRSHSLSIHQPIPDRLEVPTVTAQSIRLGDDGESSSWKKNSSRNTWTLFRKKSIGWKVKLSTYNFQTEDGEVLPMAYIAPSDFIPWLMANHPEVLAGGMPTQSERALHLEAFWEAYRLTNPDHAVFEEHGSSLCQVLPILWHGDEGRGKRRGNTVVTSLETPLSMHTAVNVKKRRHEECECDPPAASFWKYHNKVNHKLSAQHLEVLKMQSTTMKGHSFLHRFLLFIIPSSIHHAHPGALMGLLEILALDLRRLFFEGFSVGNRHYAVALLGAKGDLKWYKKIALERCWENKGIVRNIACCHECGAGVDGCPFEDMSETPVWANTRFSSRPWTTPPPMLPVPVCKAAPEKQYRRDPFHLCKVGIYRDLAGSCLLWMVSHDYFGNRGDVNDKLATAHGAFKLFCVATSKSPALRSFTRALLMYPRLDAYPWFNTKGSDTTLLLSWLVTQCAAFINSPLDPADIPTLRLMKATCHAAKQVFVVMNEHRLWQTHFCAMMQHATMQRFVTGYMKLAECCLNERFNGFAVKPKLHLFKHQVLDLHESLLQGAEVIMNWNVFNCEPSEDVVGRISRLSRRVDSRRVGERVLQCYLVKVDILHRRFKKLHKI